MDYSSSTLIGLLKKIKAGKADLDKKTVGDLMSALYGYQSHVWYESRKDIYGAASREDIALVAAAIETNPQIEVVVDVAAQEVRFGGKTIKATLRESARDALVNGRWDSIAELLEGASQVQVLAKSLPYLAA